MKYSTFATLIFIGSVVSSPHRHLHQHVARQPKQEQEAPVTWVTEVVVKTVQVTATVWVTPLAEPTPALVEPPATEESVPTNNTPGQFFESQLSTEKDSSLPVSSENNDDPSQFPGPQISTEINNPSSEIASEIVNPIQPNEPHSSTEKYIPSSETALKKTNDPIQPNEPQPENNTPPPGTTTEKTDYPNEQTTSNDQPLEIFSQPQGNRVENYEVPKPLSTETEAPEPSIPTEPLTASTQISTEASSGANITSIEEHATAASCSPSSPCDGDITYYDPGVGYGACGWKNTKNEPVVALPHEFMGSRSNGNQYCGKTITIVRDGKKSTARVVDKCMGCTGYSLDLSDAVFSQLAALSVGRTSAKWWVN